jgi:hypothetical protein
VLKQQARPHFLGKKTQKSTHEISLELSPEESGNVVGLL